MEFDVTIGSSFSPDCDVIGTLGLTRGQELTLSAKSPIKSHSLANIYVSSNLPNYKIISSETGHPIKEVCGLKKQCGKKLINFEFRELKMRCQLESLRTIIHKLIVNSVNSRRSVLSVYIPQADDTSPLAFRAENGNAISCCLSGRSCIQTTCSHQKGTIRCRNVDTSVTFQRIQKIHEILRTRCDLEMIRSECKGQKLPRLDIPGESQVVEARHPFLLIINKYLRVVFVSRNIWKHLGYQQKDMLGHCIGSFVHPNSLSELLRLTRRHARLDEDISSPLWMTGKVLMVAMKSGGHKPEGNIQDTEYMQVQWNVNVRLNNRGPSARVRDLVVLCRSVRTDSDEGICVDENVITNYSDLTSRHSTCDISHINDVKRVMERGVFDEMKRSGLNLASLDLEVSNYLTMNSKQKEEIIYNQLFLEHILGSHPLSYFVNSVITPRQQKHIIKLSHSNAFRNYNKSSAITVSTTSKEVYPKPAKGITLNNDSSSTVLIPANVDEAGSSNAALNMKLNEMSHECHNIDARSYSVFTNFDRSNIKHNSLESLDSSKQDNCHSTLTLPTTTSSNHSNQVYDFSGTFDKCALIDNLSEQANAALDQLTIGESSMSSDSETFCHSVSDFRSIESSIKMMSKTAAEKITKVTQPRNSLKAKNIKKYIKNVSDDNRLHLIDNNRSDLTDESITYLTDDSITDPTEDSISDLTDDNQSTFTDISLSDFTDYNNRSDLTDNSLSDFTDNDNNRSDHDNNKSNMLFLYDNFLPFYYSTQERSQQSSEYGYQNELKVENHFLEHCNADCSSNLVSSKVSSTSQMKNIPPSLIIENMKTYEFLNTSPKTNTDDILFRRNSFHKHNNQIDGKQSASTISNTFLKRKSQTSKTYQLSSPFGQQNSLKVSDITASMSNLPKADVGTISQIMPTSNALPSFEYSISTENSHTQNEDKIGSKNMPLLVESTIAQSETFGENNNVLSKMTNKNFDPFLSETSFNEVNTQSGNDMFDDLTYISSSVNSQLLSPVSLQHVSITGQAKLPDHIDHPPPSSMAHAFTDSSESMTQVAFATECLNELDSFLNTIPLSPCNATSMNSSIIAQPISVSERTKPDTITNQSSELVFNDSSDSETSCKPSLLRSLLDQERLTVHGPKTYTEWVLEQIPKKNCDIKKTRRFNETQSTRHIFNQHRKKKNLLKKSRELPMIYLAYGHMKFGGYGLQGQKVTKELPLPSSVKEAVMMQSPTHAPQIIHKSDFIHQNDVSDIKIINHSSSLETTTDLSLPEDLLDMAMEYCAPLEMDQAEALISDLNGSCSWEDNLYSLLETSGQEKPVSTSSCMNTPQQLGESVSSPVCLMLQEPASYFSISKENLSKPSMTSTISVESSLQNNTNTREEHKDKNVYHSQISSNQTSISSPKLSTPCVSNLKFPFFNAADSVNINKKMSLLRAAIISPDVDKLIEQIPFTNAKKNTCPSQQTSSLSEQDPDIVITNVIGLQKSQVLPSVQIPHCKVNIIPSASTVKPTENISKFVHSSKNHTCRLEHKDTITHEHVFTTGVSIKDIDTKQPLQNSSSSADPILATEVPPSTSPLVIKISLATNSAKIVTADPCSKSRSRLKPICHRNFSGPVSHTYSRTREVSNTDLSSTHPVSVMIMRKENHRSRRSKSIAIQTDNIPGEVYPEFEHNTSDTILYPSVVVSYPSVVSPGNDNSPLSTSISSQSSICDVEKCLLSQSNSDDSLSSADNDHQLQSSSSSVNENYQLGSSSSFLLKLLTGELSKDHYQRLDQQLLEKERKKSIEL